MQFIDNLIFFRKESELIFTGDDSLLNNQNNILNNPNTNQNPTQKPKKGLVFNFFENIYRFKKMIKQKTNFLLENQRKDP